MLEMTSLIHFDFAMLPTSLRILIVAPNASARLGGEAFLPLNYFRLLRARGHEVHLLTHARNRRELETLPGFDPDHVHFIPDTQAHKLIWQCFRPFPERVRDLIGAGVMNWLDAIYRDRIIRGLRKTDRIDLIHQPTPVSPLIPTNLHRHVVPLVVGPMNGDMDYPPGYEDYEGRLTRLSVAYGRKLARFSNLLQRGKRRAAVLLVANERTRQALPTRRHPRIEMMIENGIDFSRWSMPEIVPTQKQPGHLRLVFMGRLIPLKGVDITFQAMAMAHKAGVQISLDVLGDGRDQSRLEREAQRLGVKVVFHGFRPQNECAEILSKTDALVLNSLKECGGAVVLEAMAMGLPVVASDWGGPADYVTPECGILVHPVPRADFAQRLADAFVRLAQDPDLRTQMGKAGHKIARRDFCWENKVDQMVSVYRSALAGDPALQSAPQNEEGRTQRMRP